MVYLDGTNGTHRDKGLGAGKRCLAIRLNDFVTNETCFLYIFGLFEYFYYIYTDIYRKVVRLSVFGVNG